MSQPGETTNFQASDHVEAIRDHAGFQLLDCAVVSTTHISPALRRRYAAQHAAPVEIDTERLSELGLNILEADLLQKGPKVRHNPAAIGAVILQLAEQGRLRRARLRE
jgi:2-phospho-L-lactate transferase/gluconeogenesis factor (CofD/UPF0052 family)